MQIAARAENGGKERVRIHLGERMPSIDYPHAADVGSGSSGTRIANQRLKIRRGTPWRHS
jgi:hypothetical protein